MRQAFMKLIGLTGGVGMGKSTAAKYLREFGFPIVDTDQIAREVVEPGCPALAEVQAAFGPETIGSDGRLRRDALARRVFADPSARQTLEAILHPRIRQTWLQTVEAWRKEGQPAAIVVIPLLFETSAQSEFDATICVACSAKTQESRLLSRGWSPQETAQRIQAQWPTEKKMAAATFVVWSEGPPELYPPQLEKILQACGIHFQAATV